jgi:hypothetical protein
MIPNPRDGIASKRHGRTGREHKFEPFRHLKSTMGQVTMQIEGRANSAPEKKRQHDGEIEKVKARQQSDQSEYLQRDEDDENEKIELFVFEHAARWARTEQPTGPQLNPERCSVSHGETIANRYSRKRSASSGRAFRRGRRKRAGDAHALPGNCEIFLAPQSGTLKHSWTMDGSRRGERI